MPKTKFPTDEDTEPDESIADGADLGPSDEDTESDGWDGGDDSEAEDADSEADDEASDDDAIPASEDEEALDELEAEELEMLTEDEASEALVVNEAAEMRATRLAEIALENSRSERAEDEFLCQNCFLLKKGSQLADKRRQLCNDCA